MVANEQDAQQLTNVIEQYRLGFATMDAQLLESMWDQDYDQLIYIAQEADRPVRGWAETKNYYRNVADSIEHVTTKTVSDVSMDVIGDVAHVFARSTSRGGQWGRIALRTDGTRSSCAARTRAGR